MSKKYELIEILGIPALFSNERIIDEWTLVCGGMLNPVRLYKYELREGDYKNPFATVEKRVVVNYAGTIITLVPLEFGNDDYIELDEDTAPNFTGESFTLEEFAFGDSSEIHLCIKECAERC